MEQFHGGETFAGQTAGGSDALFPDRAPTEPTTQKGREWMTSSGSDRSSVTVRTYVPHRGVAQCNSTTCQRSLISGRSFTLKL
jgi:hypothetical protein